MIIQGHFIGDAPYFAAHLKAIHFEGFVWFLADTGASRTILLDRDLRLLKVPSQALEPALLSVTGIGGSVRSFAIGRVKLTFASDEGEMVLQRDLSVVQHDLDRMPPEEVSRILRLPSILSRDLINLFQFRCNYQSGIVQLER